MSTITSLVERPSLSPVRGAGGLGPGSYDTKLTSDINTFKRRTKSTVNPDNMQTAMAVAFGSSSTKALNNLGSN